MASYFFRVEHDLLRSEAFKTLGGSAIKVYLVIGLYSDFGTDWAYPSIRTIARQAGLSRQTVLDGDRGPDPGGAAGHEQVEGTVDGVPDHPPAGPAERPSRKGRERGRGVRRSRRVTGPEFLEVPPKLVQNL